MTRYIRGFSLLEALITVSLVAALVLVTVPTMFRFFQVLRLESAAYEIATNLRLARNASVKQKVNYKVLFSLPRNYEIQNNKTGAYLKFTHTDVTVPQGVQFDGSSLTEVVFNPRGRATLTGGSYVLLYTTEVSTRFRVNIQTTGAVSVDRI